MKSRSAEEEYGVLLALTDKLEYAVQKFAEDVRGHHSAEERSAAMNVVRKAVTRCGLSLQRYRRKVLGRAA